MSFLVNCQKNLEIYSKKACIHK